MSPTQTTTKAKQLVRVMLALTVFTVLLVILPGPTTLSQSPEHNFKEQGTTVPKAPLVVRVGAIYYDDSDSLYSRTRAVLSALESQDQIASDKTKRPLTFKLAVGTYDEVLNWYESRQIDLAIMSPGLLALVIDRFSDTELNQLFVGIRSPEPPATSIAASEGINRRPEYNVAMLVNRQGIRNALPMLSTKTTLDESEAEQLTAFVLNTARRGNAHFLFVHPFSASGYIYPRKLLKDAGVQLIASQYDFTYSHDVSVEQVRNSGSDTNRLTVAFVNDQTERTRDDDQILAIRGGRLSRKLVQDALLFTQEFSVREKNEIDRLKTLLQSETDKQHTFGLRTVPRWQDRYKEVRTWIDELSNNGLLMSDSLTIDQIVRRIDNYNLHHPDNAARLALVLSGGGAKCAYQLGAVGVIEEKLKNASTRKKLGIDLVVGTSGGAINALTVAAEVTKNAEGRAKLKKTWQSFGQSEILQPSKVVQTLLGLSLGLSCSLFILFLVNDSRLRQSRRSADTSDTTLQSVRKAAKSRVKQLLGQGISYRIAGLQWHERTGVSILCLALIIFGLSFIPVTTFLNTDRQLRYHVWIHMAEYVRQLLVWVAVAIFVVGAFLGIDLLLSRLLNYHYAYRRKLYFYGLVTAILLTMAFSFATVRRTFMIENSLFVSDGIQEKMAVDFPNLFELAPSSKALAEISKEIIARGVIKRDLVITGSVLQSSSEPPVRTTQYRQQAQPDDTDLYFYYKAGEDENLPEAVRKDNRFVSLRDSNQSILLDAVIGSGSIFPAFEPRRLSSIQRVMDREVQKDVYIIDGGFVHNSPIEAAVVLGATHIIVIEASPEDRAFKNGHIFSNSLAAFNHLFNQAQILDARSQRRAEIFTLRPTSPGPDEPPYLCTLDFGKDYIDWAMKLGERDASDVAKPRFVQQPRPSGL